MKILIYILEFKHLMNYSVAMLVTIVPPKWLYWRGSNSQRINFKFHFHVYVECLFSWHFERAQRSTPFASQCIDGDENIENRFIILSDYNLAWSTSKAFFGWIRRVA